MEVILTKWPTEADWREAYRRALMTVGLKPVSNPSEEWKRSILEARHSPIRYLTFSFDLIDLPSWVSVHLVRHVHA